MLHVHTSNRLESLFDDLCGLFFEPLANPLAAEVVLVQSQGMARWLSLQTALKTGIAAHFDCPFPASFIWRILRNNENQQRDPYEKKVLTWVLYDLLITIKKKTEFGSVAAYLDGDQGTRLYQLSNRLAGLFDQYMLFRPDWIERWSRGEGDGWQPILWRAVEQRCGRNNRAHLLHDFFRRCDAGHWDDRDLPERISLFGIPALPPVLLAIFARLAERREVHLFLPQPCKEYWADLLDPQEYARKLLWSSGTIETEEALHFEEGVPFLLNLGKMGREFQHILHHFDWEPHETFIAPGTGCLLHALQTNLLGGIKPEGLTAAITHDDTSIEIHVAHSPMREVEILYQNLLRLFATDSTLQAADILVMVPDISLYSPFLEAVFGNPEEESLCLPYTIADRHCVDRPVIAAFLALLELLESRMSAAAVFEFLSQPVVRQQFQISENELLDIRDWIDATAIFWGMDAQHKQEMGLRPCGVGTWQGGLDRLLLGTALADEDRLFFDIAPVDRIEGTGGVVLAKLMSFIELLRGFRTRSRRRSPVSAWAEFFRSLVAAFLGSDGTATNYRDLQYILEAIQTLEESAATAGCVGELSFDVVCSSLREELEQVASHSEFLGGGITFCQMVPMRAIPFEVICLLGMNDDAFPRQDSPYGFDLMAEKPRLGDRCRRDDDRYLFLETILSARRKLMISYVGLGLRSSELFPPSVVVSDLCDSLAVFFDGSMEAVLDHCRFEHPLQPYSGQYFLGDPLRSSFSKADRATLCALTTEHSAREGFFGQGTIPQEEHGTIELSVDDFLSFFQHPIRFLLQQRMGVRRDDRCAELASREPLAVDSLQHYLLFDRLLTARFSGKEELPAEQLLTFLQKTSVLPHDMSGACELHSTQKQIDACLSPMREILADGSVTDVAIDLRLGSIHITGLIPIFSAGLFLFRPASIERLKGFDWLRLLLSHLLLQSVGEQKPSYFVCRDGHIVCPPNDTALQELMQCVTLLEHGLFRPLPLLPRASYAYAQALWGKGSGKYSFEERRERGRTAAEKVWTRGEWQIAPEGEDPYLRLTFADESPFQWSHEATFFETCAETMYRQVLECSDVIVNK